MNQYQKESQRLKRRHKAKMLDDLEEIGHVTPVDKTVIEQHLSNLVSDLKELHEQEVKNGKGFNR